MDKRAKYIEGWVVRAKEAGFHVRNIVDEGVRGHPITKFPFAETKYTLPIEYSKLSVFWIYGDKVAISNWAGEVPIVFLIENKALHDLYKSQFELLWKR